jgi:hypothetical protein
MKCLFSIFLLLLLTFSTNLFAKPDKQLSISGIYMFDDDNLYFAEANRYFFVGDAFIFKAEFDYYADAFAKNFAIGIFANFGSPWYDGFEETSMTEFGPSLKWRFSVKQLEIIPALYIGYRSYEGNAGEALGINFSVKAQFPQDNFVPFVDFGFLSQPVGGNDDTDMTFSPVFVIGGGVGINL